MEDNKKDFDLFLNCLEEACEKIDSSYFKLNVASSDSEEQKDRERVYCYEFYHQLRCILGESSPYKLNGEVDKDGHPIIHEALGAKKPDFIVHVPGGMDKNLVVVEVKSVTRAKKDFSKLKKDLETLEGFLDKANYKNAIMLIYGDVDDKLLQKIKEEFKKYETEKGKQMLLIWHQECGKKPVTKIERSN